uniref:Uncharacterized protein n=1 Tax=Tanacetum cinerariifolium TaxID=118510 RepID=A0A6L2LEC7_TANCI|nr:hypothetical protein [Tanacetum cinerariifolium]
MVPYETFACGCGAGDVVLRESYKPITRASGKLLWMWIFFIERGTSSSTDQFSWSFIDSKLFSRTFNTSKLFSRIFNTSKLFFGIFKKCRVLKLQALA